MHANLTSTNIQTLINKIIETWRPMIESNGVTLTCFLADNISQEHEIDQRQFHNCVNTLISNAAHYTQNGRVHVHVTADDKGCLLYTSPSPRDGLLSRMPSSA